MASRWCHWWYPHCYRHQLKVPGSLWILSKSVQKPPAPTFLILRLLRRRPFPGPGTEPLPLAHPPAPTGRGSTSTQASWISYFPHCNYFSLRIIYQVASKVTFLSSLGLSSLNQFCWPQSVLLPWRLMVYHVNRHPPALDIPDMSEYMDKHWLNSDWDSFYYIYYHYCYYPIIIIIIITLIMMMMMMNWGLLVKTYIRPHWRKLDVLTSSNSFFQYEKFLKTSNTE